MFAQKHKSAQISCSLMLDKLKIIDQQSHMLNVKDMIIRKSWYESVYRLCINERCVLTHCYKGFGRIFMRTEFTSHKTPTVV